MAAAALRFAVRRLGDRALQRLQTIYTASASTAAGEGVKRNLIRTVVPTSSRRSTCVARPPTRNTSKIPYSKSAAEPLDERSKEYLVRTHLAQIQNKKEELFKLIAELDSNLPSRCTRVNKQLAIELSAQVEPKPGDAQWRWYRAAKRINNYILYGGCLTLGLAVFKDFEKTNVQKHQG